MIKKIIAWFFSVFFIICFLAFFPHFCCFFFLIAGVLLLPIKSLQNLFSFYLKKSFKIIIITLSIVLAFMLFSIDDSIEKETPNTTETSNNNSSYSDYEYPKEANEFYHNNKHINRLINDYNDIAEYKIVNGTIDSDQLDNGAYTDCNNVNITIHANDAGLFIKCSQESADDSSIEPLFRDFCKSINPNITDKKIKEAWEALQTLEYQYYDIYEFDGIECAYTASDLWNGEKSFDIRINCKSYTQ